MLKVRPAFSNPNRLTGSGAWPGGTVITRIPAGMEGLGHSTWPLASALLGIRGRLQDYFRGVAGRTRWYGRCAAGLPGPFRNSGAADGAGKNGIKPGIRRAIAVLARGREPAGIFLAIAAGYTTAVSSAGVVGWGPIWEPNRSLGGNRVSAGRGGAWPRRQKEAVGKSAIQVQGTRTTIKESGTVARGDGSPRSIPQRIVRP